MSTYAADSLELLRRAVSSVLVAVGPQRLLIGVDGRISDASSRYLDELAAEHVADVTIMRFPENRGLAAVLNDLIEVAIADVKCEFVFRMDADDLCDERRFIEQRTALRANPDIGVLGAWADVIDERGVLVAKMRKPTSSENLYRRLPYDAPFVHPTVVFRASLFRQGFRYPVDTVAFEDLALWGSMALAGVKFSNLPICLLEYRQSSSTFKRRVGWRKVRCEIKVRLAYLAKAAPYRLDIAALVVVVGIAKLALPVTFVRKLFDLRAALAARTIE